MKKSALLLITFIILGACQDEMIEPQISDGIEELPTEIDLDIQIDTDINEVEEIEFEDEIFLVVEQQASFEGGSDAWKKHLKETLKYPDNQASVEGRVFISFVVSKAGEIRDAQLIRGIHPSFDQAALDVVLKSPDWIPARQRGLEVNSRMTIAITFRNSDR